MCVWFDEQQQWYSPEILLNSLGIMPFPHVYPFLELEFSSNGPLKRIKCLLNFFKVNF